MIGIVEELKGEADAGVCISTAGMVDIEKEKSSILHR